MDISHEWQESKASKSAARRLLLDLPLELRLQIYDHCLDLADIEAFFTPSTKPLATACFTIERIPLICKQTRNELIRYRARIPSHIHIGGFPQLSSFVSDSFFSKFPMCAMMLQRFEQVSLHLHRAPCARGDAPAASFDSVVRSVFVFKELAKVWASQCNLRRLEVVLSSAEKKAYHHVEMQLLAVVNDLASLRGLRHVKISGPGPFGSEVAEAAMQLMMLGRDVRDDSQRVYYDRCYAEYQRNCEPEDFVAS